MSEDQPTLAETLRAALPEDARDNAELHRVLERVSELEAAGQGAGLERSFLERAPREGLLYPGDALKLEDIASRLKDADDPARALDEVYRDLRARRPYLFKQAPEAPAKLSQPVNDRLRESWNGAGLTRQLMLKRRK
jgi:hypothetical protein